MTGRRVAARWIAFIVILGVVCLSVAVMVYRMLQIWVFQGR